MLTDILRKISWLINIYIHIITEQLQRNHSQTSNEMLIYLWHIHREVHLILDIIVANGTISLIEQRTLLTQSELYEKAVSNMVECKSREAYLMC